MQLERRRRVLDYVKTNGQVKITDLKALFPDVSEMTLRRDLSFLEKEGFIKRVHGGARFLEEKYSANGYHFLNRTTTNIDAKRAIARASLSLLEEGNSIYLASGTTIMEFARVIPDIRIYITTNSPHVSLEIIKRPNPEVTLLGGYLDKTQLCVTRPFTRNFIDDINIDIAFISATGFSLESGFSDPYPYECELKSKVIQSAKKVAMLMDSSKINRNVLFTFSRLDEIDYIVTDKPVPGEIMAGASKCNVKIILPSDSRRFQEES